jgi:hypothetical protein
VAPAPAVCALTVADEPDAWRAAGFTVDGDTTRIGAIDVHLVGRGDAKGVRGWTWSDLPGRGPIDGLETDTADSTRPVPMQHPNGSTIIDHVVVVTPQLDRTIAAFAARSIEVRRVRDTDQYGPPFRQVFFRGGETIIELIGPTEPAEDDERPAHFYGLAFTVADLDTSATRLGDGVGSIKDAVQPGRRIATLRHRNYDISVPIAFMSA